MRIAIERADDPRVDAYRALVRPDELRRAGLFVAETRLVVRRLLGSSRFPARSVFATASALEGLEDALTRAPASLPVFVCAQAVMDEVAGIHVHRGCLALGERPVSLPPAADVLAGVRLALGLEAVGDPDNVGALFRCGAALGAGAVVLGPGCADPLYRKAIRTSMGATLRLPYTTMPDGFPGLRALQDEGVGVVALTPDASAETIEHFCARSDRPRRVLLLVGSESAGLTSETQARADWRVRIPMAAGQDSLNVAVAAAIALYQLSRLEMS